MKTFNKILLSLGAVATMGLGACTSDLDLSPTNPNTIQKGSEELTPEAVMADVYLNFVTIGVNGNSIVQVSDGGMASYARSIFILNEITTDEANWLAPGDVDYGLIQYGIASSNNTILFGCYNRLMMNIGLCNSFLNSVEEGEFAGDQKNVPDFVRQCHILRGACYFYLIDIFGNVSWASPSTKIGDNNLPQITRQEAFENITAELEAVVKEYNGNATQQYGYVGLEVAEALLVKFYLNAEVWGCGDRSADVIKYAEEIIDRHGGESGLVPEYAMLFGANNNEYANQAGKFGEIIWTLPQDADKLYSWSASNYLIYNWRGDATPMNMSGSCWNCGTIRPQAAALFDWQDANGNATKDLNKAWSSKDRRTIWWQTAADGNSFSSLDYQSQTDTGNGFAPVKYTNWKYNADGTITLVDGTTTKDYKNNVGLFDTALQPTPGTDKGGNADFAAIRLAEIFLSAAEAYFHQGNVEKAREYVNYIRKRAGINELSVLTLNDIFNERGRELYTENCRRTDLIRAGKWISGYTWAWKNNVEEGANFPSNYNVYPIPYTILSNNPSYKQNPGYN